MDARTGITLKIGKDGVRGVAWQAPVGLKASLTLALAKNPVGEQESRGPGRAVRARHRRPGIPT